MNRSTILALAAALAATPGVARAQSAAAETILHLSADASVQVAPDQLVADLLAQDTASSPADAQRRVNALIAQGMQAAHAVAAVDARAIGYEVSPTDDKQTNFLARQTLELRGDDGPALLDLTGKLQQRGFVTTSLDWRLSPASRRKAYAEATTAALKALQQQTASAAATLGLHIDHYKDIQVQPQGLPQFRPVMAMAMKAAPAPQATATPEDVTAQVSAEVVLRP